jgi:O-antigen/teichoic acid export membrane protein
VKSGRRLVARRRVRAETSTLQNSVVYSAGRIFRMSVGFLAWLAAARIYPATQVGLAASAISAMMLCGQIGILGVDLAVVAKFPEHRRRPALLIDTAVTVALGATGLCALVFLGIAASGIHALRVLATDPVVSVLFIALTVLCGAWAVMDQTAVALRRSDHVLSRAVVDGALTITGVVVLGLVWQRTVAAILAAWVAAAAVACAMGVVQIGRAVGGYRYKPQLGRTLSRRLLKLGLPNLALSVTDSAPGLILPLVAASVISTRAAAYWYAVWMMAVAAYQVSFSFGLHMFAEVAKDPAQVANIIRKSLRSGFGWSVAATVGLLLLGPTVLGLLGHAYAVNGAASLRLVALASLPLVLTRSYLFACRALNLIAEGWLATTVTALVVLGLAIPAASRFGLEGIAGSWLASQVLAAAWAAWRLRRLMAAPDHLSLSAPPSTGR